MQLTVQAHGHNSHTGQLSDISQYTDQSQQVEKWSKNSIKRHSHIYIFISTWLYTTEPGVKV